MADPRSLYRNDGKLPINGKDNDGMFDYAHASRTFRDGDFRLAPKQKFLFFVVFNYSTVAKSTLPDEIIRDASMLVKSVDLPTFSFDTQALNQYNRWRTVQTKINYQPVQVRFHDDMFDVTKRLWYRYLDYYYDDQKNGPVDDPTYNGGNVYEEFNKSSTSSWGMASQKSVPFFTNIKIYSIYGKKKFSEYTLINPILTQFQHDTHDHAQGDILENTMQIQYETVKYATGTMGGGRGTPITNGPKGFGDLHYDKNISPLETNSSTMPEYGSTFKDEHSYNTESNRGSMYNPTYDDHTINTDSNFGSMYKPTYARKDSFAHHDNVDKLINAAHYMDDNTFANEHASFNGNTQSINEALSTADADRGQSFAFPNTGPAGKTTPKRSLVTQNDNSKAGNTVTVRNEDGTTTTVPETVSEPMSGPWDKNNVGGNR
jgi:hypothetical protein